MKLVRALSVITLLVVIMSVGLVSALEQNEASVKIFVPGDTVVRGETGQLRILFTSNTDKDLEIHYIGIHLDWMEEDQLFGIDYSSAPKTVLAGKQLAIGDIINYTIPTSASVGVHKYYIGIDGYDEDGNPFSWMSDEETVNVINPTGSTGNPSATPTGTSNNQNPQGFDFNILLFVALGVAAVVIVLLVLALMKKRGPATANADRDHPSLPPEEKPDQKQDFNI